MSGQQISSLGPGMPVRHGGDIYRNPVRHDFSINLNPLGMPEGVKRKLLETVEDWACYPDPECEALRAALSAFHKVPADKLCPALPGNWFYHGYQPVLRTDHTGNRSGVFL